MTRNTLLICLIAGISVACSQSCSSNATPVASGSTSAGTGGKSSGNAGTGGNVSTGGSSSTSGKPSVGGSTTSGGGASTAGGAPSTSQGCDAPSGKAEGEYTLMTSGVTRGYHLVPSKTKEPVPLVVGFHGYGGNGKGMVGLFGQEELSAGKAVFIYPDGVKQAWYQDALGWDQRSATTPDTVFIKDLVDAALKEHCIDATRVYAVGFSWGGYMSNHVGCALGDRFRATASFSGGASDTKNCTGPASSLFAHGTADQSELISEGRKGRDEWLKLSACASTTKSVAGGACVAYDGCTSPVWWCEHAGSHQVPANLKPVVWDFLRDSPL